MAKKKAKKKTKKKVTKKKAKKKATKKKAKKKAKKKTKKKKQSIDVTSLVDDDGFAGYAANGRFSRTTTEPSIFFAPLIMILSG